MAKYIYLILISIILILGYSLLENKKKMLIFANNEKAYIEENSKLKESSREFKFTIEQLNYYNDSILNKLNNVKKELRIKDKNLKHMSYLLENTSRTDTIIFRDTIFNDPKLSIDTIIGNEWYTNTISLRYPNIVIDNPKFINEKYIIAKYKKETVDPPKKFFLFRWFQKKQKVVEVIVVEKNPYSKIKQQRFIEIIK